MTSPLGAFIPKVTMSRTLGLFATVVLVVRAAVADPVDETTAHEPPSNSLLTALSPMLARWIESSRDAAIAQGVEKIPESIRASLAGYVPDKTLAHVRWRAGGASDFSLQQNAFLFKDAQAVTLKMSLEQTIPQQSLTNPALPGSTMNVEKGAGLSAGTQTIRFSGLVPTSEVSGSTAMAMTIDMGGQTQKMSIETKLKVSIAPQKK